MERNLIQCSTWESYALDLILRCAENIEGAQAVVGTRSGVGLLLLFDFLKSSSVKRQRAAAKALSKMVGFGGEAGAQLRDGLTAQTAHCTDLCSVTLTTGDMLTRRYCAEAIQALCYEGEACCKRLLRVGVMDALISMSAATDTKTRDISSSVILALKTSGSSKRAGAGTHSGAGDGERDGNGDSAATARLVVERTTVAGDRRTSRGGLTRTVQDSKGHYHILKTLHALSHSDRPEATKVMEKILEQQVLEKIGSFTEYVLRNSKGALTILGEVVNGRSSNASIRRSVARVLLQVEKMDGGATALSRSHGMRVLMLLASLEEDEARSLAVATLHNMASAILARDQGRGGGGGGGGGRWLLDLAFVDWSPTYSFTTLSGAKGADQGEDGRTFTFGRRREKQKNMHEFCTSAFTVANGVHNETRAVGAELLAAFASRDEDNILGDSARMSGLLSLGASDDDEVVHYVGRALGYMSIKQVNKRKIVKFGGLHLFTGLLKDALLGKQKAKREGDDDGGGNGKGADDDKGGKDEGKDGAEDGIKRFTKRQIEDQRIAAKALANLSSGDSRTRTAVLRSVEKEVGVALHGVNDQIVDMYLKMLYTND